MALVDSCLLCQRLLWLPAEFCLSCEEDIQNFKLIRRSVDGLEVFSLLYYRPPAEALIKKCKASEFSSFTRRLARVAAEKLALELIVPVAGVLPVPAREFGARDHAFFVAEAIAEIFRVPTCSQFVSREDVAPQKEKSRDERLRVQFRIREPLIDMGPGSWILADDVVTTGSTLAQVWKTLGRPPAVGLTLASTPRLKDFVTWPA